MSELFVERFQICQSFVPVDMTTAANTGDWISMADARRAVCILSKAVGTAGQEPVMTFQQAVDAAGTSAKTLACITRYDSKAAATDLTATGTFTKTTQAAGATVTLASCAAKAAIIVVEIKKEDLDAANGFSWVQCSIPDVGANSQLGDCLWIVEMEYLQETLPTCIA